MLNGRCKVWKDANGNFHATLTLDTPKGVLTMQRSAALTDAVGSWDPTAPETGPGTLIKKKVEYIAGFFPTDEVVGEKAYRIASELVKRRTNPETAKQAQRHIDTIKAAAVAGDDEAFDIDYAVRKIARSAKREQVGSMYARGVLAGDDEVETLDTFDASLVGPRTEIGWRIKKPNFKKLAKFAKKSPLINPIATVKAAIKSPLINPLETAKWVARNPMTALMPPVAAFNLLRNAKKRQPAAVQTVAEVRRLAEGLPPVPAADAPSEAVVEDAQKALENLRAADAVDSGYAQPAYEQPVYEEPYYEEAPNYDGEYDTTEGDQIGSFLSSLKKKVSGALSSLDPSRPGSFTRPLLSNLPFVGPGVKASLDLLDQAKKLNPSAIEKIKTVKSLADAGVPKALAAKGNLQAAQELSKEAEKLAARGASTGLGGKKKSWFPLSNLYRAGLTKGVA